MLGLRISQLRWVWDRKTAPEWEIPCQAQARMDLSKMSYQKMPPVRRHPRKAPGLVRDLCISSLQWWLWPARPDKRLESHAKSKPEWYCDKCRGRPGYPPCPGCGAARPDNRAYHVKNMPEWTCAKCLPKACSQCGRAMHRKAASGTWCHACAFPPGPGCEAARPTYPDAK